MANEPANHEAEEAEAYQFQRQLSENSMEYMIFLLDDSLEGIKYLQCLEAISKEAARRMDKIAENYIWQRDEFQLQVVNDQGLIYLHGTTDYGDAVEDEWLTVYVLRELSKTYPKLFIRVADEDGEFLLVEAASALPNWLNPEIDYCRVWIQGGKLKIIPLLPPQSEKTKTAVTKSLTLPEAISCLRKASATLIHSPSIEDEAFYRLGKYPEHVDVSIHYSTMTIPRKLAYVIHELPKTISAAVEAFYLRDHAGMRKITSESEKLHLPPTDMVTVSVKFSRVLFAQLRSQHFEAPRRWQNMTQKQTGDEKKEKELGSNLLATEDGMKLTCGYEMLALTADKNKSRIVRELAIMLQDFQEDGDEELPTNEDIATWPDVRRNDDEGWLDIDYEDFERELEGNRAESGGQQPMSSGFGDSRTQDDLRKIVSRFEAFLNNETAGLDGAEIDEMDMDNDDDADLDDNESDENSDMEDKEVSFDEETFSCMMKEMMGLPVDNPTITSTGQYKHKTTARSARDARVDDDEDDEEGDIKNLTLQMEAELKGYGALQLDGPKSQQSKLDGGGDRGKGKEKAMAAETTEEENDDEDSDEEVDVDYNLAKNLLESFKSQGGMAGPAGNLIGLMGIQLPRDEDDGEMDK
ncbi:SGT1 domain containing protein [Cordyceps fumosorosea ARSEF 2679]|uniref:SGT1 domain containing protein n=1 Tax=Cordyceps fumosorosea (strain ARSEF 2679) TaxID=1081104 RepID=A0A168EGQ1_CORFA|nr:SGT1 domain containing protein [Cordyceps fumosorosea ARSEF 2679]OAA73786.1 SGT1 domain containing protein [Cordyceps fumosorosea ARSEF 2679]